jgi:hypothetical protein
MLAEIGASLPREDDLSSAPGLSCPGHFVQPFESIASIDVSFPCHPWQTICAITMDRRTHHFVPGGTAMTKTISGIVVCLLYALATGLSSEAATNFNGSTIVGIDQAQHSITFQTKEGQTWTLPVADPAVLNKQISKGDRVSIETDLSDRIIKILTPSDQPPAEQSQSPDSMSQ